MSHGIIIDESGMTKAVTLDRLRVKEKSSGTTDYTPPSRWPYTKLIVYRNGTYTASDYGLRGFDSVEVRVGSRRDGRRCDTEYHVHASGARTQSILVGGKARNFSAGKLNVRMGSDADSARLVEWEPKIDLTLSTTTISHQGTYTPSSGAAWSAVTVNVSDSEVIASGGYVTPPDYEEAEGSYEFAKIRGELHDHFWMWVDPLIDDQYDIGTLYYNHIGIYAYRVDLDFSFCATVEKFSMWRAGSVRYSYPSYSEQTVDGRYAAKFNCIDAGFTEFPNKRNGIYLRTGSSGIGTIRLKARLKFGIICYLPEQVQGVGGSQWTKNIYQPWEPLNTSVDIQADNTAGYVNMSAGDAFAARFVIHSVSEGGGYYMYHPRLELNKIGEVAYQKTVSKYNKPDVITDYTRAIESTGQSTGNTGYSVPITDVLYSGAPRTAPDWAKTITDYDL